MSLSLSAAGFRVRIASAWRDALASAIAACIAWILALWLFGHPHPLFAAITAIVCLSPGLPSHGQQAAGLMLGVAIGIVVGELALLLPEGMLVPEGLSLLRLFTAILFSILIAALFGQPAVVAIQAGVSAALVLALGPENAGLNRLEDVGVGVAVGLLFSQVLLTPDPIRTIDAAADALLLKLAGAFRRSAAAAEKRDSGEAEAALSAFSLAHGDLVALGAGIEAARYATRWSLRGRLAASAVAGMAARYDRRATRLYASCLLFGEALTAALRHAPDEIPEAMVQQIFKAAESCETLARTGAVAIPQGAHAHIGLQIAGEWQDACLQLRAALDNLASLEGLNPSAIRGKSELGRDTRQVATATHDIHKPKGRTS